MPHGRNYPRRIVNNSVNISSKISISYVSQKWLSLYWKSTQEKLRISSKDRRPSNKSVAACAKSTSLRNKTILFMSIFIINLLGLQESRQLDISLMTPKH